MAFPSSTTGETGKAAASLHPQVGLILLAALACGAAGFFVPNDLMNMAVWAVGVTLLFVAGWSMLAARSVQSVDQTGVSLCADVIQNDPAASLLTGADGTILFANKAAQKSLSAKDATTLAGALQKTLANPGAILFRLETRAEAKGSAVEDIVTRQGHVRLSVHKVGEAQFLWRVERSADGPQRTADPMPLPMFTLGRNDAVLFMNPAARDLIGERARSLDRICAKMPLRSGQLNDINTPSGAVSCFALELEGVAGRREVFLIPGVEATESQPDGWAFFDELPVPLLKLARTGEIQLSNRHARDLLGVPACQGATLGDFMEGLGRSITDWLDDAAAGRGTSHSEILRIKREDKEIFAQVTLNRAMEDGETVLIAGLNDATKLKSLEAQFVQSQKMQAIGQLAGGVAHDFNNLLTAISGHCDLLLLRHDQGDADFADLTQINQNANRAAALVGQLLAYSRKQTLRPEILDLQDTLSDLGHLLNRLVGEKMDLSLSHDPILSKVKADKRQLEQVVVNLVVNARDAMPKGGKIQIKTENITLEEPLRYNRAVVPPGQYVSIKVIDEGMGIPKDKLQKVFEPFFTTKRTGEGTGLGLSTAYGIVKQSGGFIFAHSELNQGTEFQILLPAYEAVERKQPKPAIEKPVVSQSDGVVLLVEDEAPVRAFASRALQLRGFNVLEAESAEDALELLQDKDLQIDIFVSDVVMPGKDGPSWVKEALTNRPDVHVVFMSGYAEETFSDSQSKIPNSVFLPKPFSLTELTETVQRQMPVRETT